MSHNARVGRPASDLLGGMQEGIILLGRADGDANTSRCAPSLQGPHADALPTKAKGKGGRLLTYVAIQEVCPGRDHMKAQFRKTDAQTLSLFCVVGECLQNVIFICGGGERGSLRDG